MNSPAGYLVVLLAGFGAGTGQAACWHTQTDSDGIEFVARQAGAPVSGHFRRFQGHLCLPEGDAPGEARVDIDTASIDMGMAEFDAELRGPAFLDTARWPEASFVSRSIEPLAEDRYAITGDLTLRDITREVRTEFVAVPRDSGLALTGELVIQRLDFDVGLGEWQDTEWVGDEVTVRIDTVLGAGSGPDPAL